jgi:hypothetical protein
MGGQVNVKLFYGLLTKKNFLSMFARINPKSSLSIISNIKVNDSNLRNEGFVIAFSTNYLYLFLIVS